MGGRGQVIAAALLPSGFLTSLYKRRTGEYQTLLRNLPRNHKHGRCLSGRISLLKYIDGHEELQAQLYDLNKQRVTIMATVSRPGVVAGTGEVATPYIENRCFQSYVLAAMDAKEAGPD